MSTTATKPQDQDILESQDEPEVEEWPDFLEELGEKRAHFAEVEERRRSTIRRDVARVNGGAL